MEVEEARTESSDLFLITRSFQVDNITYDGGVVFCEKWAKNFTSGKFQIIHDNAESEFRYVYEAKRILVPTNALRPFWIKQSKNNQSLLSVGDISKIRSIHKLFNLKFNHNSVLNEAITSCLALIGIEFGASGVFYAWNTFFNQTKAVTAFNEFYAKYLRAKYLSLAKSANKNKVKIGDLMFVGPLKKQKSHDSQIRAQAIEFSFCETIPFISGLLKRRNSRKQKEFAVQSLTDQSRTLALRPKYLYKLTKIHIHNISNRKGYATLPNLVSSLLEDKSNKILYLPHKGEAGEHGLEIEESSVFMMQQMKKNNVMFDAGTLIVSGYHLPHDTLLDISHSIMFLQFILNMEMWDEIIQKLKTLKYPPKFIAKTNGVFKGVNEKYARMKLDKIKDFPKLIEIWRKEVEMELSKVPMKKYEYAYCALFEHIREELMTVLAQKHPDYMNAAWHHEPGLTQFIQIRNLYRISVVRHYFRAMETDCDLHVICYGDVENGFLKNLNEEFSKKMNVEWKIGNMEVAKKMADRIIQRHSH